MKFTAVCVLVLVQLIPMLYCKGGGHCLDEQGGCCYWCMYYIHERSGYCTAKYEPGGPTINIEPIDPVTASLKENAMAQFAKDIGFGCDVSGEVIDALKFAEKSAEFASHLAKGLGIMGTLLGGLGSKLTPTPADIIKAVNEALAKLTQEINDQFANMEEYVDQSIRKAQQDAMTSINGFFGTMFANCLNEVTESEYKSCLHQVERDIGAASKSFMHYKDAMNLTSWSSTPKDIKQMETDFLSFMDFALLRTVNVLTMAATYYNDTSEAGKAETCRFLLALKLESKDFLDYTEFIYRTIMDGHQHDDEFLEQNEICEFENDCWQEHSGILSQWTGTLCDCRFKFSRMLVDSDNYRCIQRAHMRRDEDCPSDGSDCGLVGLHRCPNCADPVGALAYSANGAVKSTFHKYTKDILMSAENYWKPQTIERTKIWDQLGSEAKDIMYDRQCENTEFSKIKNLTLKEREEFEKIKQELITRRSKSPHSLSQKRNSEEL